jgi:hypothetical protein
MSEEQFYTQTVFVFALVWYVLGLLSGVVFTTTLVAVRGWWFGRGRERREP